MRRLTVNLGTRAAAFFITVLLCLNSETDRMVRVDTEIPIVYGNLPDSLVQMGEAPEQVRVRAEFNRKFWQTRPEPLAARLDLTRARRGTQRFPITPEMVRVPPNRKVRVVEILDPRRIPLVFEPKIEKRVPVFPHFEGTPEEGFVLHGQPEVEPVEVVLSGPESVVRVVEEVLAAMVSLNGVLEDVRVVRPIDLSQLAQVSAEPSEVEVFFDIERIEDRILQKRPIRTAPRYRIRVEPDSLDLVVRGPAAVLSTIRESRTRLYVDVSALPIGEHAYITEVVEGNLVHFFPSQPTVDLVPADTLAGGGHDETLPTPELEGEVQNLPDLVVLVDTSPKVIIITRRER